LRVALVIGRSKDTWKEVDEANKLVASIYGPFDDVIAVNDSGHDYPRVDHWVSYHADKFPEWQTKRTSNGYSRVNSLWTCTYGRKGSAYEKTLSSLGVQRVSYTGGGSSGMVAVLVALDHLGCSHTILAGVPMDVDAGHYNQQGPWKEALRHRSSWDQQKHKFGDRVRSMSGYTRQILGAPDKAWLCPS
jgi:hypothetical protein